MGGLAGLVRRFGATAVGARVGRAAYGRVAQFEAGRLARLPGVRAVYATGSLLGGATLAPGQSDIDLVVVAEVPRASDELCLLQALEAELRRLSLLGGLFHNLDLVSTDELPLLRALGPAWAIELDRHGICLAGSPAWKRPAERPGAEVAMERFCRATRRFVNAAGLLLDPRRRLPDEAATRLAGRLVTDIGFSWLGEPRHQALPVLDARLGERGLTLPELRSKEVLARVGAALELLDLFARDMAVHVTEAWPLAAGRETAPALDRFGDFARAVLGGPLVSCAPLRRAPALDDWVPVVVADGGARPGLAVRELSLRLAREVPRLEALPSGYRRPVPSTPAIVRAAALFDPAPFTGAALSVRDGVVGEPLPVAGAPSNEAILGLVRARTVEAFVGLRSVVLRRTRALADRDRETERRYGILLPALGRALSTGALAGRVEPARVPGSAGEAAELRRAFFAAHAASLGAAAAPRLAPEERR